MNDRSLRRSPTQVAEALATAEELFERGLTLNQIATTLGITTMTLYRWRRKHNSLTDIEPRTEFGAEAKPSIQSDALLASLYQSDDARRSAPPSQDKQSSPDQLIKELRWLRRLAAELLLKNQRLEAELRGELDR